MKNQKKYLKPVVVSAEKIFKDRNLKMAAAGGALTVRPHYIYKTVSKKF